MFDNIPTTEDGSGERGAVATQVRLNTDAAAPLGASLHMALFSLASPPTRRGERASRVPKDMVLSRPFVNEDAARNPAFKAQPGLFLLH